MRLSIRLSAISLLFTPALASAQKSIPIRKTSPVVESAEHFGGSTTARALPNGHVLVHDAVHKRVLVFDSLLKTFTVSADSVGTNGAKYPALYAGTQLIPYLGDSTLFTDMNAKSLIVIDPFGTFAHAMAHPKTSDLFTVMQQYGGVEGTDAQGRLIYRATNTNSRPPKPGELQPLRTRDTINIVRADFNLRTVDSIASFTVARSPEPIMSTDANGKRSATIIINPLPQAPDEFAVMTDGTIAVIRSHDYHVDFVFPDGRKLSSEKLPFDWRRVSDEEKQARTDSLKRVVDSITAMGRPYGMMYSNRYGPSREYLGVDTIVPSVAFVPIAQVADYLPPIRSGAIKPDADGNVWILPTTSSSANGGLLYDVVNKKGELAERVQIPPDCVVSGFGKGGVVFLSRYVKADKYWILERTRVLRAQP